MKIKERIDKIFKTNNLTKILVRFKNLKKRHKVIIIISAVVFLGAVITSLLLLNKNDNISSKSLDDVIADTITESGTYIVVRTNANDLDIEGLQDCKEVTKADNGFICELFDDKTTVTFTAPEALDRDDALYEFNSWTNCKEPNNNVCKISMSQGSRIDLELNYRITEKNKEIFSSGSSTESPAEPYLELKINYNYDVNDISDSSIYGVEEGSFDIFTKNREKTRDIIISLITKNIDQSKCTITDDVVVDDSGPTKYTDSYEPLAEQTIPLIDGTHSFRAECPSSNEKISVKLSGRIRDHQPKLCKDFNFTDSAITVNDLAQLKGGIVGKWEGCVETPSLPLFFVTITFNSDGTYSATGYETLDGTSAFPMRASGQQNSPHNTYDITNFDTASNTGSGSLVVVFSDSSGSIVDKSLVNIKLMDDKLLFEFERPYSSYDPIIYRLYRQ